MGFGARISPKALLDLVDHHVADHLTGDAAGRGDPADNLAIMQSRAKAMLTIRTVPGR